jgi:diketogulonate reductase-like aldo/keto reductase
MVGDDFSAVGHGRLWLNRVVSPKEFRERPAQYADFPPLGKVCRLGLATRGNTALEPEDVLHAIDCGVNYLNWCTHPDGMSAAVRQLGPRRKDVFVAAQLYAHTAAEAEREMAGYLAEMQTDYLDALTYYYLEDEYEWKTILSKNGAMPLLEKMKTAGTVRVTSHQRTFAAGLANTGRLDCLMIRYNAAHRGAETEIFPITEALAIPVISYTGVRWGALLEPNPDSLPFSPASPSSAQWIPAARCRPECTRQHA